MKFERTDSGLTLIMLRRVWAGKEKMALESLNFKTRCKQVKFRCDCKKEKLV